MILQALVRYYEALAGDGRIDRPGYGQAKVSYALCLGRDGALVDVVPLLEPAQTGKKIVERPRTMTVPEPVVRTVGIAANFLCDGGAYLLGYDAKGKPERALKCFEAAKALHTEVLAAVESPIAQAIVCFFASWDPGQVTEHPALAPYLPAIAKGANLIFMLGTQYAQDDPEIRAAWTRHAQAKEKGERRICLVTGERTAPAILHPKIKGVREAQSSGASIVSFNARAFESYGHDEEQGLNAPVGEYAAFAYTTALNALLASPRHRTFLGDMTLVYWSEDANEAPCDLFAANMDGYMANADADGILDDVFKKIGRGEPLSGNIDPQCPFYILALAPNAARISVRFFLQSEFGDLIKRLMAHYERLKIVKAPYEPEYVRIPLLLEALSNPNAKDKKPPNALSGALVRDILQGGRYPPALLSNAILRIRAEREVGGVRAAIVKAYLLQNSNDLRLKEACEVELQPQNNHPAYVLGRLFAVLEQVQQAANPGINATIKDRYFNAACATPRNTFAVLYKLANAHLRKIEPGLRISLEKQITALYGSITVEAFPAMLTLEEQSVFILGYHHQTLDRYTKKQKEATLNG